jgi:hypothetical protein
VLGVWNRLNDFFFSSSYKLKMDIRWINKFYYSQLLLRPMILLLLLQHRHRRLFFKYNLHLILFPIFVIFFFFLFIFDIKRIYIHEMKLIIEFFIGSELLLIFNETRFFLLVDINFIDFFASCCFSFNIFILFFMLYLGVDFGSSLESDSSKSDF